MTRGQMSKQISTPPAKKKTKKKIPPKYLKGLSPANKVKRKKEIKRNAPKADNDPSAYKFSTDFDKKANASKQKNQFTLRNLEKCLEGKRNDKEIIA